MSLFRGIEDILKYLEDDEVIGLASTVTQGFLKSKINTREEAIKAVLKYSPNEVSVLKRKAVTKEVLFKYLHDNNVPISLPVVKYDLVNKILEFWNINCENNKQIFNQSDEKNVDNSVNEEKPDVNLMAFKFTEWFYSMMNREECIGPEHFWADAKLILTLISDTSQSTEQIVSNPQQIVELLYKTKCDHKLYFNPNLAAEGVQGRMDPHGLVIVLSCGTLHTNDVCAGVFEQMFALARDPFSDNNWKIKNTELNLRSKRDVQQSPMLIDNDLTGNLLSLPSN